MLGVEIRKYRTNRPGKSQRMLGHFTVGGVVEKEVKDQSGMSEL